MKNESPPLRGPLTARQTLALILLPMLATFAGQRLFLHLAGVHHVRTGGHLIHHLFFGVLIVIPAAFLLAFDPQRLAAAVLARVALGIGSAMVLDEVVYLVATQASDADYVSPLSLKGALILISLACCFLLLLYRLSNTGGILDGSDGSVLNRLRQSQMMKWLSNLRTLKTLCLIMGVGLLGVTISIGAEDSGSEVIWGLLIACSLFFIFWGLTAFKKPN